MMTLETALLTGLSTVTTALCGLAGLFYQRLGKAEKTVERLLLEVRKLDKELSIAQALLNLFKQCPRKADCPFSIHHQKPEQATRQL